MDKLGNILGGGRKTSWRGCIMKEGSSWVPVLGRMLLGTIAPGHQQIYICTPSLIGSCSCGEA